MTKFFGTWLECSTSGATPHKTKSHFGKWPIYFYLIIFNY